MCAVSFKLKTSVFTFTRTVPSVNKTGLTKVASMKTTKNPNTHQGRPQRARIPLEIQPLYSHLCAVRAVPGSNHCRPVFAVVPCIRISIFIFFEIWILCIYVCVCLNIILYICVSIVEGTYPRVLKSIPFVAVQPWGQIDYSMVSCSSGWIIEILVEVIYTHSNTNASSTYQ